MGTETLTPPAAPAHTNRCPCGRYLHYENWQTEKAVKAIIAEKGWWQQTTVTGVGSWWVPRHYTALHGLRPSALPALAAAHHWPRVAR
ncbi:MAG: hypothetical protein ACRDXE_11295 [Acidimicrobiales bacterium]